MSLIAHHKHNITCWVQLDQNVSWNCWRCSVIKLLHNYYFKWVNFNSPCKMCWKERQLMSKVGARCQVERRMLWRTEVLTFSMFAAVRLVTRMPRRCTVHNRPCCLKFYHPSMNWTAIKNQSMTCHNKTLEKKLHRNKQTADFKEMLQHETLCSTFNWAIARQTVSYDCLLAAGDQ